LAAGKIDVVLAAENYKGDNLVPLCQLGEVPFYFGVSKSRTDLLEQLDNAMSEILTSNINYNSQLRAKYMTSSVSVTTLTNDEKEWLQENGICVGYLSDYMPYCGTDKETGQMTGMLADLLSNIKEEYSIYCTTISYGSYSELMAALQNGEVDAVFPFYGDYSIAEYMNVMVSDAVTQTSMTVFNGESVRKEVQKIAVTDTDPFQKYYASIYYPEAEQISCETLADCVDSVIAGETEFTVVETARVNESENTKYKKRLQTLILNESVNISFAINIGNKELINIINKAIMSTDDSLITNSLIYHSQEDAHYTVMDFMREHVVLVVLVIVVIFGIITANIVLYFVNRMKSQRRIWEAETKEKNVRWKAEHDSLTGLLNRASFQEICNDLRESVSPLAILVIDVDKFKSVNDTYGHETGDKALVKVAKILSLYFRSGDYVIRYAGDEFVVMMIGVTPSEINVIAAKIGKINENLQHPDDDLPKISLSVGIAFSEKGYTEDLFSKADQALYHAKEHGRCGYSVYE
jgi:diguanylate cyclase (GGDEF)-like protein